jgi:predicted membrane-bound mannosyltransferase
MREGNLAPQMSERSVVDLSDRVLFVGSFLRLVKTHAGAPSTTTKVSTEIFALAGSRYITTFTIRKNYHGPTLYYFAAIIPWIVRFFGAKRRAIQVRTHDLQHSPDTVVFGIGTIWLALCLRKRLGSVGALAAAALIAISPGAIYLSRYLHFTRRCSFLHVGHCRRGLEVLRHRSQCLLDSASVSAALMVATKETWIINAPVLLIALCLHCRLFSLAQQIRPQT